jgi:hypothetical protein
VWFGNNPDFSTLGMRKKAFIFSIKNPLLNNGEFSKTLMPGQWKAVRQIAGDANGGSVYWYVECWDGLRRHSSSEVMSFVLSE